MPVENFNISPVFDPNVFTVSDQGAAVKMNANFFVDEAAAAALAQQYGAIPVYVPSTSEFPFIGGRWACKEIPPALQKLIVGSQVPWNQIETFLGLPAAKQWALWFVAQGITFNAGYLARYFVNNPPDQFPGLADSFCRAILRREGVPL